MRFALSAPQERWVKEIPQMIVGRSEEGNACEVEFSWVLMVDNGLSRLFLEWVKRCADCRFLGEGMRSFGGDFFRHQRAELQRRPGWIVALRSQ